ncbi:hypothetical protein [Roseivirga sp. E12]|uniref:hypothetical protein n=1 Tax=Roseivirga sp. E12 TaxID=2819237 RepID=UPI001ABC1FBF|nr:hypothetical protein [Roseivirga sp. E12]MBO3697974.1 hypothetical protein [Roseivirga sp. E12]
MKKLNIKIALTALALFATIGLSAQEAYSVSISNASSTTIVIKEVNRVSVEAYDGTEVLIENSKGNAKPERAEGLKALSSRGEDNTGIGLNVEKSGNEVTIFQAARRPQGKYTIKVPKSVKVQIEHTGNWEGGKIEVYGVTGELEISGRYNSVYLEDVSGPALVNTVYGKVEAIFTELSQSGPTSLVSVYSTVDVTLPANTKADVSIKTPYGEAYSDMEMEFPKSEGMRKVSSTVQGTLNGGGVELAIKASYSNAYLRKK